MKQAINTRTQEEYDALMGWRKSRGETFLDSSLWEKHKHKTTVSFFVAPEPMYSHFSYFKELGYTITPFKTFAKTNGILTVDYKALCLEGWELLERVCDAYTPETNEQDELEHNIKLYLTNHKDGE